MVKYYYTIQGKKNSISNLRVFFLLIKLKYNFALLQLSKKKQLSLLRSSFVNKKSKVLYTFNYSILKISSKHKIKLFYSNDVNIKNKKKRYFFFH